MPAGAAPNATRDRQPPFTRPPANAVSILVYMTSRPISRFVTGFQIVREPTCQAFQSAQPGPKPRGAQISRVNSGAAGFVVLDRRPRSRTAASWSSNAGSPPARSTPSAVRADRGRRDVIEIGVIPPAECNAAILEQVGRRRTGTERARRVHAVSGRAFAVLTGDRERVPRIPRHLQQEARGDSPAPLVIRMCGDSAGRLDDVVGRLVEMQSAGDLGRAPSLVDAQVADDVGRLVTVVEGGVVDAGNEAVTAAAITPPRWHDVQHILRTTTSR